MQLLSNENTLALALEDNGKVVLINYSSGYLIHLASVADDCKGVHMNSLLQVLPNEYLEYYMFICKDGKNSISKYIINKQWAHLLKWINSYQ